MFPFLQAVLSIVKVDQLSPTAKILILILALILGSVPVLQDLSSSLFSLAREIALSFSIES